MCEDCWREKGAPADWNEDIKTAVGLIREIYQYDGAGNPLHVVLDDWNLEDCFIKTDAIPPGTDILALEAAQKLVPVFLRLTEVQRAAALAYAHDYLILPEKC